MKFRYCLGAVVMLAGALQAQSIYGTITDAVTGKPIRDAVVMITEISRTITTDGVGHYSMNDVGMGTFTVKITAPQYLKLSRKVIIASPKEVGISDLEFNAGLYNISSIADTSKGMMSITYQFPMHGDVELVIQNALGKKIRKMYDRSRAGGIRTVSWNGKNDDGNIVPAGRYTCKVSSGRLVMIRTLVWKGAAKAVPPAQSDEVTSPPAAAPAVPAQPEEPPAKIPALPPHDTVTPVEVPEDSAE
jgi:hypothetical protein